MSRNNTITLIYEETATLWKNETINYLKGMQEVPQPMVDELMGMLRPHFKPKGHYLLEPYMFHTEATYLRSGRVKLFIVNTKTLKMQILHIWLPGQIIVLYDMYRKRKENKKFFIQISELSELVSISIDHMDLIYENFATAEKLTVDILSKKSKVRMKHAEILGIDIKADRYQMFAILFPELMNLLSNDDLCEFLGISEDTLITSRLEYAKR